MRMFIIYKAYGFCTQLFQIPIDSDAHFFYI